MANEKVSSKGTGTAGYRSSRWAPRAIVKAAARKLRRNEDRSQGSPDSFEPPAGRYRLVEGEGVEMRIDWRREGEGRT